MECATIIVKATSNMSNRSVELGTSPVEYVSLDFANDDNEPSLAQQRLPNDVNLPEQGVQTERNEPEQVVNEAQNDVALDLDRYEDEISGGISLLGSTPDCTEPLRRSSGARKAPSEWWKSYVSTQESPLALL